MMFYQQQDSKKEWSEIFRKQAFPLIKLLLTHRDRVTHIYISFIYINKSAFENAICKTVTIS